MVRVQPDKLARLLETEAGHGHVTVEPGLAIDGHTPAALVKPGSSEEAAACLRVCGETGAAVAPAGLGTWLECGNPLRRCDVVLSLERMNRVVDYSPPDLTVTVEAALSLHELNSITTKQRQWLPLDPPGASRASVGAICACASSGPLRFGFGTPRDYVIGLQLAHADGTVSKSGGRVVKNVAGYDMNKLYVGSFGTLAVLTQLTFKLRPLPERSATVRATAPGLDSLVELGKRVLEASELQPASVFALRGAGGIGAQLKGTSLLIRFLDSEPSVNHQVASVIRLARVDSGINAKAEALSEADAHLLWNEVADIDRLAFTAIRISVPMAVAPKLLSGLETEGFDRAIVADLGAGIVRIAIMADDEASIGLIRSLRAEAAAVGGSLFVERGSPHVRRQADAWGEVGPAAPLMRSLKMKFDPGSILNPGRFAAGI